jgi:hypothetical protein
VSGGCTPGCRPWMWRSQYMGDIYGERVHSRVLRTCCSASSIRAGETWDVLFSSGSQVE